MESTTSFDDCYFYYYSSCTKGSDCSFRHCEAALGTETVCSQWRQGTCYRSNCKFRHMESRIDRSSIPCFWENMPGGCRKPHCVFFHQKYRSRMNDLAETGGLILPVASQPVSPSMSVDNSMESKWEAGDSHSLSPSHPIQPVVVSLDEGEESDTESTASTPMKANPSLEKRTSSPPKVLNDSSVIDMSCARDFGIKTLEQIKMAKIHRESEHFYNADEADFMDADTSSECAKLETVLNEPNTYYSQVDYSTMASEVTPMDLEAESYQNASLYPTEMNNMLHRSPKPSKSKPLKSSKSPESAKRDLRDVLKRKRYVVPNEEQPATELSTKRIISLKKPSARVKDGSLALTVTFGKENEKKELPVVICTAKVKSKNEGHNIGFRVKTLDEIRKEKEKRQNIKGAPLVPEAEVPAEEDSFDKPVENIFGDVKEHSLDSRVKPKGSKRRLRRKPIDLYKPPRKQANDLEDSQGSMIQEQDSSQMSEDMAPTDETSPKKVSMEVLLSVESAEGCKRSISLKRTSSDVPALLKVQKSSAIHTSPHQKVDPESDEEKLLKVIEVNKKIDDCLAFKRRNIMRRKNIDFPNSQPVVENKDSECQLQNSDSQEEFVTRTPEHLVSPGQNGSLVESEHSCAETKEAKTSVVEKEAASNVTSPSIVHIRSEKKSLTFSTVDELDTLFLGSDGDICLEEVDANTDTKAEDLFLEFEQMLQS